MIVHVVDIVGPRGVALLEPHAELRSIAVEGAPLGDISAACEVLDCLAPMAWRVTVHIRHSRHISEDLHLCDDDFARHRDGESLRFEVA